MLLILKENLSLCSFNYFGLSICKLVGSVFFLPLLVKKEVGVHNAHHHMGLLTLQVGHTHLYNDRLCIGPSTHVSDASATLSLIDIYLSAL